MSTEKERKTEQLISVARSNINKLRTDNKQPTIELRRPTKKKQQKTKKRNKTNTLTNRNQDFCQNSCLRQNFKNVSDSEQFVST